VVTITVAGSQRSTTSVSVTMTCSHRAPTVTRKLTGRTLQLGGACPDNENCNVSMTVQVPHGIAARVTNSVGDISVSGLTGPVTARHDQRERRGADQRFVALLDHRRRRYGSGLHHNRIDGERGRNTLFVMKNAVLRMAAGVYFL
jgi:hypothetical protein